MSLRLHDTATRSVREFVPLKAGQASIYVCGATVQGPPHVGHVRSGVVFDVLARWMRANGIDVTLCRNVTDIDDKILAKAIEEGRPWWAVATDYEHSFADAYDALGCTRPTVEPRATGHIPQIIELINRLVEGDHAYPVAGDVYFSVRSFAHYGQLSGQRIEEMLPTAASEIDGLKRDPRDFALWKAAKPGEPAWDSPWGPGRPGWHIECSAMATAYLGAEFDIHGGGLDLVFPHHENEIAQAQAAGDGFARYWLHNSWVTTAGEKMSKSLGNSLVVAEVLGKVRPVELRWYLVSAHYRSTLEFSDASLAESAAGYRRLETFVLRAADLLGADSATAAESVPEAFRAAMDDDLNVPAALAVAHSAAKAGNQAITDRDEDAVRRRVSEVRAMLDILGVDPLADTWSGGHSGAAEHDAVGALVEAMLDLRAAARAAKDFATADAIRDHLTHAGIAVEDTPRGPRWTLERN